jgi:hypothetical protein
VHSTTHTKIISFNLGIADDVLRDLYVRGKYRDVILPFTVLGQLDSVLEPTKKDVLRCSPPRTTAASPTKTRRCARPPSQHVSTLGPPHDAGHRSPETRTQLGVS